eukprot:614160-Amphidinium_carterae.1
MVFSKDREGKKHGNRKDFGTPKCHPNSVRRIVHLANLLFGLDFKKSRVQKHTELSGFNNNNNNDNNSVSFMGVAKSVDI